MTLQATTPLFKKETLEKAIESFINSHSDTCIIVINKPHLSWSRSDTGYFPNYR